MLFCRPLIIFYSIFWKNSFKNIIRGQTVWIPIWVQTICKLSADDNSRQKTSIDMCTLLEKLQVQFSGNTILFYIKIQSIIHNTLHLKWIKMSVYHDVAPGSKITPCNKIVTPLVVYRFSGNVMTSSITMLRYNDKIITFLRQK